MIVWYKIVFKVETFLAVKNLTGALSAMTIPFHPQVRVPSVGGIR